MKELNKIIILGTGSKGENGEVCATRFAKDRIHRAVEAAAERDIPLSKKKLFLIAGGYSEELFEDGPPPNSEADAMRDYALDVYGRDGLTEDSFLLEKTSTNTYENVVNSIAEHPKFFRRTALGKRCLGVVSHEDHVERAAAIIADKLDCSRRAITQLAIRRSMHVVPDLSRIDSPEISLQPTGDD